MADREFSYKGKVVKVVQPDDQHAEVEIEDRRFAFMLHGGALPMWMCDDAYFGAPELDDVIRHLIDYWYIVTREQRAPASDPEETGASGGRRQGGGHHH